MLRRTPGGRSVLVDFLVVIAWNSAAFSQGLVLPGAGPINLSMAGASTAAAVDVGGSYWNPAIISGLPRSEMLFSSQFLLPSIHLQSSLPAGSVGGFFPPRGRAGTSRSDGGVGAVPTAILAFRLSDDSPWTFSLGSQYLVGGGVNFSGSTGSPIVGPHDPPRSFGLGPIYSNLTVGVSSVIASRQVTDRLAVAAGPLIAVESLAVDPAVFATPIQKFLTGGYPTFPSAFHQRPFWGAGSRSACSTSGTSRGTWASRTRARSGRSAGGTTRPRPPARRTGSACRRACRRSSRGAWPIRVSRGP